MSDHIDTLKKLHTRLIDSRDGYRESRKQVSDEAAFVGFFDQRIAEREKFHTELHRQLGVDGVDVSEEGSAAASAFVRLLQLPTGCSGSSSATCGCTTYKLNERKLEPEAEVELDFVVDTRGKLGLVEKTITIHHNASESPWTEIIVFHAFASGMEGADTQAIFSPPCSTCHLDSGINKKHKELYEAVCGMCHPQAEFHSRGFALREMIMKGQKSIAMPGFEGYLSEDGIQSLIDYLEP